MKKLALIAIIIIVSQFNSFVHAQQIFVKEFKTSTGQNYELTVELLSYDFQKEELVFLYQISPKLKAKYSMNILADQITTNHIDVNAKGDGKFKEKIPKASFSLPRNYHNEDSLNIDFLFNFKFKQQSGQDIPLTCKFYIPTSPYYIFESHKDEYDETSKRVQDLISKEDLNKEDCQTTQNLINSVEIIIDSLKKDSIAFVNNNIIDFSYYAENERPYEYLSYFRRSLKSLEQRKIDLQCDSDNKKNVKEENKLKKEKEKINKDAEKLLDEVEDIENIATSDSIQKAIELNTLFYRMKIYNQKVIFYNSNFFERLKISDNYYNITETKIKNFDTKFANSYSPDIIAISDTLEFCIIQIIKYDRNNISKEEYKNTIDLVKKIEKDFKKIDIEINSYDKVLEAKIEGQLDYIELLRIKIEGKNNTIFYIIVILLLLAGAGIVVFVYKKRNNNDDNIDTEDDIKNENDDNQNADENDDTEIEYSETNQIDENQGMILVLDKVNTSNYVHIDMTQYWKSTFVTDCYIHYEAVLSINNLNNESSGDKSESGGFLLGKYYKYKSEKGREQYKVYIDQFIKPSVTEHQDLYQIKFGTTAMLELDNALQRNSDLILIGWYHTHPGHTPFLSSADIKIHDGTFHNIYQIALVVDPKRDDSPAGIFTKKNGRDTNNYSSAQMDENKYIFWDEITIAANFKMGEDLKDSNSFEIISEDQVETDEKETPPTKKYNYFDVQINNDDIGTIYFSKKCVLDFLSKPFEPNKNIKGYFYGEIEEVKGKLNYTLEHFSYIQNASDEPKLEIEGKSLICWSNESLYDESEELKNIENVIGSDAGKITKFGFVLYNTKDEFGIYTANFKENLDKLFEFKKLKNWSKTY